MEKYRGYCATDAQLAADDSYVCLPCFRRLGGVIILEQQLADKRKKIAEDLEKSVSAGAVSVTERVSEPLLPSTPLPPAKLAPHLQGDVEGWTLTQGTQ